MLKKLEQISSKLKYSNPYWDYKLDQYVLPDGTASEYHYIDSRGSTIVIPKLTDNRFIFIRQYRYLNQRISLEFPGGGVKKDTDFLTNAKNELEEETGYISEDLTFLSEYNPFNGVTNEICKIYLAESLIKGNAKPEDSEEFEVLILTKNEIIDKIRKGELWDGMTLAAWSIYLYCTGENVS